MPSLDLLKSLYLFKNLDSEQISLINSIAEVVKINAGELIFDQGEPAKAMYFIQYGSIKIQQKVSSGDVVDVAVLGTGSHFGEMAFLDSKERSAVAKAVEKSEIVVLQYDQLKKLLDENKDVAVQFYKQLAHFLGGRLRMTTNDLSFCKSQNLSHF